MGYKVNLNDVSTVDNGLRVAPSMRWQDGFEPVLCKTVALASGSVDTDIDVDMKWRLLYVDLIKDGAGGAGTTLDIIKDVSGTTTLIGSVNFSGSANGDHKVWAAITASACTFNPGNILRLSQVQSTGSSACRVNLYGSMIS